jgi:capsid protein
MTPFDDDDEIRPLELGDEAGAISLTYAEFAALQLRAIAAGLRQDYATIARDLEAAEEARRRHDEK